MDESTPVGSATFDVPQDLLDKHNRELTEAWRSVLPEGTVEAGFHVSYCIAWAHMRCWAVTSDGTRHTFKTVNPLFNVASKVHVREFLRDGRGMWLTLVGRLHDGTMTFQRDWMRRPYWDDNEHPQFLDDPWTPPADPALIRPTEMGWLNELTNGQGRLPEFMPEWAQGLTPPPNPLDESRPLPPELQQIADHPVAGEWFAEISRQLMVFTERMCFQLEDFQADRDSIEGDAVRGVVLENVPLEVCDTLWQRNAAELAQIWTPFTREPWPEGLPEPPAGRSIASLKPEPHSKPVEMLNRLDDAIFDLVAELMESRIRR